MKSVEEIIIDGVNVAECEFLRKCVIPDNEGCKIDDSLCCDVGNCYYKQLQKALKENYLLKEALKGIKNYIDKTEKYGITSLKHIKNIISEVENG